MTTNKANINLEEFEEYTDREIEYIDKYKVVSKNTLEVNAIFIQDEELYDLIIKYNFDDERIREAVLNHVNLLNKKGDDYSWAVVTKGKSIIFLSIEQKPKDEEKEQPVENFYYKYKNNNRKPKFNNKQNSQEQLHVDQSENNDFTQNRRGNRGNRRARARGGNRGGDRGGNRGGRGRRNYDRNEFIETHLPSDVPLSNVVQLDAQNNEAILPPLENTNNLKDNFVENIVQEEQNITENIIQEQNTPLNKEVNDVENNTDMTIHSNNNNLIPIQTNEIQNVESFFHKFTLDRENEVNKLLEEQKTLAKEKDHKLFYQECLNHFIRDNNITLASTYTYKPIIKPSHNKNTINSQPQLNYSQTPTNQASTSSTNKNYPHKPAFNQHPQNQETPFYSQQAMMNMYPFLYPQAPTDSNMTNPQFFPQMMPPQMMYFMNQFVIYFLKLVSTANA